MLGLQRSPERIHISQSIVGGKPSTLVTLVPLRRNSKRPSSPVPLTASPDSAGDRHLLPFLRQLPAIGGEILARGFLAVPLHGVKQDDAAGLFVLQQFEGAAAPVRRNFAARALPEYCSSMIGCSSSPSDPPTRLLYPLEDGLGQFRFGGFDAAKVFLRDEESAGWRPEA